MSGKHVRDFFRTADRGATLSMLRSGLMSSLLYHLNGPQNYQWKMVAHGELCKTHPCLPCLTLDSTQHGPETTGGGVRSFCYSPKMKPFSARVIVTALCALALSVWSFVEPTGAQTQQTTPAPNESKPAKIDKAEFEAAADEVLQQVSQITGLKLVSPLKKTIRSREEIRAYVLRQMDDEKNPAERYADERTAEAFGLLPKGFPLDSFMVDLLTEQIAGLYDPTAREFYIADWIPLDDQRMVMAHELTHALQDQHFKIEAWVKAARPNDDAELARESVLEGSAMAAMIDYLLKGTGHTVEDLPTIDPSLFAGDMSKSPKLQEAPQFLKDTMIFPYLGGLTFSAAVLKPGGWSAISAVFSKPPVSTQQIMHPALYKSGKTPEAVKLPSLEKMLGADWPKLDENTMGEFGWKEILKQFSDEKTAAPVAAMWTGDRYAVYEQKTTKKLILLARLRLDSEEHASRFFEQYADALLKKHKEQSNPPRASNFLTFDSPDGGVFLRCFGVDCVTAEGVSRANFDGINEMLAWPAAPAGAKAAANVH
jgi:hypothetical protein